MTVTINGTTGASLVQDATITSAKIVDGTIAPADLTGAQTGSAPIYGCRAWCVFNGTTGALINSGNVASITRNGVGDYTVTFTTAMQDTTYAVSASCSQGATGYVATVGALATGSVGIKMFGQAGTNQDSSAVHVAIFR